jgi:hypothetical protein
MTYANQIGIADRIKTVNGGNLDKLEEMLTAQAEALNAIFNNFAMRHSFNRYASVGDLYPPGNEGPKSMQEHGESHCRNQVSKVGNVHQAGQHRPTAAGEQREGAGPSPRKMHDPDERTINRVSTCGVGHRKNGSGNRP